MGGTEEILEKLDARLSLTPQVVYALRELTQNIPISDENRYETFQKMLEKDPELYAALTLMASFIAASFKGVMVEYGEKLDEKERQLIRKANLVAKNLKPLIYRMVFSLLRDGDVVILKDGMKILPMSSVTAVTSKRQVGAMSDDKVITEVNYYVLNEGENTQQVFPAAKVHHISLNPTSFVTDNFGRDTWGIWSRSPLDSLRHIIMWKLSLLQNDMLWRDRLVPRLHHQLKSDQFKPELYAGKNIEEKVSNAKSAAQTAISEYAAAVKRQEMSADQAYITLDNIKISVIEPKSSSYSEPNLLIEQLNHSIDAATGVPISVFSGSKKASLASELITISMFIARAKHIVSLIEPVLWDYITRKIPRELPVEKLSLVFDLTLEKDKGDIARQIAVLKASGILTVNELRRIWGAPMLSDEEVQKLIDEINAIKRRKDEPGGTDTAADDVQKTVKTPEQITQDETRKTKDIPYKQSPQEKKNKQITLERPVNHKDTGGGWA